MNPSFPSLHPEKYQEKISKGVTEGPQENLRFLSFLNCILQKCAFINCSKMFKVKNEILFWPEFLFATIKCVFVDCTGVKRGEGVGPDIYKYIPQCTSSFIHLTSNESLQAPRPRKIHKIHFSKMLSRKRISS